MAVNARPAVPLAQYLDIEHSFQKAERRVVERRQRSQALGEDRPAARARRDWLAARACCIRIPPPTVQQPLSCIHEAVNYWLLLMSCPPHPPYRMLALPPPSNVKLPCPKCRSRLLANLVPRRARGVESAALNPDCSLSSRP